MGYRYLTLACLASISGLFGTITGVYGQSCSQNPPFLTNGDFETGQMEPWKGDSYTGQDAQTTFAVVSPGHNSQHAVQINAVGWGGAIGLSDVAVCAHTNYTVSFDYKVLDFKSEQNCTIEAIATSYPDADSRDKFAITPGDWQTFSLPYENKDSPSITVYISPSCWLKTDTTTVVVDNIEIATGGSSGAQAHKKATTFWS